jgi:pimeloyl-ACP methyl ester carboxylesterase
MDKVVVNGISLAYARHGKGTPLVLLHGYPLDHTIWDQLIPLLENKADLILPDLRGFGASDAPESDYSIADMAADVAALMEHLQVKQAAIAGHSMGGYIALAFARAYPIRLGGLGLVSSQAVADTPEGRQKRFDGAEQIKLQGVKVVADSMPARLTSDSALQAALREVILRQPPQGLIGALKAMAGRPDSTSILPGFDFEVVMVHGLDDGMIPVERAQEVQKMVPRGKLAMISAVGHMPMMKAPQKTADALALLL